MCGSEDAAPGLDPGALGELDTRWLGRPLQLEAEVDSTNSMAGELAAAGAPHGAVVVALAQRAGRGRRGRTWHSPAGDGLYLSAVLRPRIPLEQTPLLSLAAAVGLCGAVEPLLGPGRAALLKWPNDLLVRGGGGPPRKLSGVLLELRSVGATLEHLVLGVGLNVYTRAFPPGLRTPPTSLALERPKSSAPLRLTDVLLALLRALEAALDPALAGDHAAVREAWQQRAPWLGQEVTVELGEATVQGRALGLAPDGALRLATPGGERRLHSGEISRLHLP